MNNKSLATLSPLCLALFAANAWADLEPFSFGASEQIQHESNLGHTDSSTTPNVADWESLTKLNGAINEPLGRDKLQITGDVDFNRYKHSHTLDSTGYNAAAEFDWSTVGDLSGSLGADSHRHQYFYGESSEFSIGGVPATTTEVKNMQTDNHVFARAMLGGESRWTIFGGADADKRNYSAQIYQVSDEHQWSADLGTRFATSPDLSFGVTGNYVRGEYPEGAPTIPPSASKFNSKSIAATTQWQVSGNTHLDGSLGETAYYSTVFGTSGGTRHFMNGSLNLTWTPPSHLTFRLGLKRSADSDALTSNANGQVISASNVNGTAINTNGRLDVTYAFSPKTSLEATADYIDRKYLPQMTAVSTSDVSGSTRTSRFFLTAHYLPTRTTDVNCGAGRETRHADYSLSSLHLASSYTDNYVQCTASITFD